MLLTENLIPTAMNTSRPGVTDSRSKKPYNPNAFCDYCHMNGHMRSDCHKLLKCDFCQKTGHLKLNCFRLIGYPLISKAREMQLLLGIQSMKLYLHHMTSSHQAAGSGLLPMPMITPKQHQNLLQMLDQTTIRDANGVANMAGHVQLPKGDSTKCKDPFRTPLVVAGHSPPGNLDIFTPQLLIHSIDTKLICLHDFYNLQALLFKPMPYLQNFPHYPGSLICYYFL
ncbi:hypothetical protein H5410_042540 [Solanum commersonii]|uniref:Uncharacterized protein n=1 Tax=Solanum commersonii TaxID=4109 RepID=A0A9J5XWB0_SOLCO|nr:hypothetical protein H5410_042540 [Solanum commersonii]